MTEEVLFFTDVIILRSAYWFYTTVERRKGIISEALLVWIVFSFFTYCHRVLHVGHGRRELTEVQLRAVNQRMSEISTAAACTHTGQLPLLTVRHHSCVVLSCGDSLDDNKKTGFSSGGYTCSLLFGSWNKNLNYYLLVLVSVLVKCTSEKSPP